MRVWRDSATAAVVALAALAIVGCGAPLPTQTRNQTPTTVPSGPIPTEHRGSPTWERPVGTFPLLGTVLMDMTSIEDRFVIGGSIEAASTSCPDQRDARIWTSEDAQTWTQEIPEEGQDASVIGIAGSLAIGRAGCAGDQAIAWRSIGGAGWSTVETDGLGLGDEVLDIAATDDQTLVASGHWARDENVMGVWLVTIDPGSTYWQAGFDTPPSVRGSTLTALAANERRMVGFDTTRDPYAWYSVDADSWHASDLRPSYGLLTTDAISDADDNFLAAGRGCCGLPDRRFGVVVQSTDGQTWTGARPNHFAQPIEAIVATDIGLIALGAETYLSSDGSDWRLGPPLPGYVDQVTVVNRAPVPYRLKLAVVGDAVVAMSPTDVWVASLQSLAADRWPNEAPAAAMPVVGETYEATLQTHCGPFNGPLYFAMRSWLPDLPEGSFPLSFDYYNETGSLDYAAEDRLEFTGSKGDVVVYLPSDDPPHGAPCH